MIGDYLERQDLADRHPPDLPAVGPGIIVKLQAAVHAVLNHNSIAPSQHRLAT